MSLQRRLIIAITLLLFCLLTANLIVTVHNARVNIYEQLAVHAQDTATSLGFSITQAASAKDNVQVSSMIDVIFDRGYYSSIVYRDLDGTDIVKRALSGKSHSVPSWFAHLVRLPEPSGQSVVSSGWFQLGEIVVVSNQGFAYQDLWRSFTEQLWLFLVTIVLSYGLLGIGLKFILRPLRQVEEQAEAICRREFKVQPLPSIPELRRVVFAMNRMVDKLKTMFGHQVELNDRLHQQLRTDDVTGLSNRRDFDERLQAYLASERTANVGALMLMQIGDLQHINRHGGRHEGDSYLQAVAQQLVDHLDEYPEVLYSRHSGADFAIFIPAITEDESQQIMERFYSELQALEWSGEKVQPIYIGVVYAANLSEQLQQKEFSLLAAADAALNKARTDQQGGTHWEPLESDSVHAMLNANEWLSLITTALDKHNFSFRYQPVWKLVHGQNQLLFNELLTHLTFEDNDYSASVFMPMAMRLQLMPAFDRHVMESLFSNPEVLPEHLCLNISAAALEDEAFIASVEQKLQANPAVASRLVFELPANSLSFAEQSVRDFATLVKRFGAELSLHHFGRGTAEFAYMQTLPLDYLKIDRCFIQNIVDDVDAQFFVRSLVTIAQSCDVMVLAEGVETEAQWEQLVKLGIQGGQGYWLGKPQVTPVIG
ncbi:MAG: bifunctional diguanylate cyclase/phosphodiesterase [Cellvibrionaceae bacterium]